MTCSLGEMIGSRLPVSPEDRCFPLRRGLLIGSSFIHNTHDPWHRRKARGLAGFHGRFGQYYFHFNRFVRTLRSGPPPAGRRRKEETGRAVLTDPPSGEAAPSSGSRNWRCSSLRILPSLETFVAQFRGVMGGTGSGSRSIPLSDPAAAARALPACRE